MGSSCSSSVVPSPLPGSSSWDRIREIIRNDARSRFEYKDNHGDTCVLGGLAEAAGLIIDMADGFAAEDRLLAFILRKYPALTMPRLYDLRSANDMNPSLETRRLKLIALIDQFEQEDKPHA